MTESWNKIGEGTPCGAWLEVAWLDVAGKPDFEKTTQCFCRIINIGGEAEWIWRDGATTVTHHSLSAPKYWRWPVGEQHTHDSLRAANKARDKEWSKGKDLGLLFWGVELGGEVGEALNVIKKIERERMGLPGSRATKAQLAQELADVVICADLTAMQEDIDLNNAIRQKFNATSLALNFKTRLA